MRMIYAIAAAFLISFSAPCVAQSSRQIDAKLMCGPHTANAQKLPAYQVVIPLTLSQMILSGERNLVDSPGKEVFAGLIGPSGDVMLIAQGNRTSGNSAWTYEFHGKFNPTGATVLKGNLRNTLGIIGSRACSIIL